MKHILPANSEIAVIGDIHGMSDALYELVRRLKEHNPNIHIFSTGDLVDRGPDSEGVVMCCIEHNIMPVLGNHDDWVVRLLETGQADSWCFSSNMGGRPTVKSWSPLLELGTATTQDCANALLNNMPEEHKNFFLRMPVFRLIEIEDHSEQYIIVHAGIDASMVYEEDGEKTLDILTNISQREYGKEAMIWSRAAVSDVAYKFKNGTQVVGHTPVKEVTFLDKLIAVDTGAVFPNIAKLSAVILPSMEVIEVDTNQTYFKEL